MPKCYICKSVWPEFPSDHFFRKNSLDYFIAIRLTVAAIKIKRKKDWKCCFSFGRFGLRVFVGLKRKFYVFMMSLLTQTIFCSPFNFILIRSVAWGKYKPQNLKKVFYCNRKKFEWFMFQNIGGCCRSISLVWPPSTSWLKDWIEIEQGLSTPVIQLLLNCYSTVVIQLLFNCQPCYTTVIILLFNCYAAVIPCNITVAQLSFTVYETVIHLLYSCWETVINCSWKSYSTVIKQYPLLYNCYLAVV